MNVGEFPAGVAVLGWQQEYTAAHNFKATTLTDDATIAWDLSSNQAVTLTLGGNRTLQNPTFAKAGGVYVLFVTQDATGSWTLNYGSNYRWSNANLAPTLTAIPNRTDILTFVSFDGKMYGSGSFNYTV